MTDSLKTELGEFSKDDISIEHFNGCPAFVQMTAAGFTTRFYGSVVPSYRITFTFYKDTQGDYCTLISDQDAIGSLILREYLKDPKLLPSLHAQWLKNFKKCEALYSSAYAKDLSTLTNGELLAWSEEVVHVFRDEVSMPGFIDGFMFYADRHFPKLVKEFCESNRIGNPETIASVLSAPTEPSFLNEEEASLRALARDIAKEGYSSDRPLQDFLSSKKNLESRVEAHLFKYSWIKSSYVGYVPYTFINFENEVCNVLTSGESARTAVFEEHVRAKQALIEQYSFTEEILAIVRISELLVKWQDQRKNYSLFFVTLESKIVEELSRRTGIPSTLLRYTETREFPLLLNGRLDVNALREREQGSIFIYKEGRIVDVVAGENARDFFNGLSTVDVSGIREVKGTVASVGSASGLARVVLSIADIASVKEGEILVTSMTRPEHVSAMKKAAAIVTDDGGITSHAAIVSRELRKPCIIGTKIGTKIFNTGDMIKVDAEKGVVSIVHRRT